MVLEKTEIASRKNDLDRESKQSANLTAHKLAGSLGSLGFADGSKLASELEAFLDAETFPQPEQIEPFNELVCNLRDKFDRYDFSSNSVLDSSPLLLIMDNDREASRRHRYNCITSTRNNSTRPTCDCFAQNISD
ncbi:Hpt domain-containing protein [Pleurocapsa sp. FMAR1]|uniref:Hpt domain-containing protein n=1 Tax=Pleurocapsa sp. FMAR1 TaxID=3040204 RepID=UPI0029C99957|nr:Hpt domain-containing protein [Pleurocapsa sp. FMAR1]